MAAVFAGVFAKFRRSGYVTLNAMQTFAARLASRLVRDRTRSPSQPQVACGKLELPGDRAPAAGSRKLSVPTATSVAPTSIRSRAWPGALHAAHSDDRNRTRAATAATCASATARIAGPDRPPVPPPSHARPLDRPALGRERHRPQRVDQRHRVGAGVLGCQRAGATSAVLGVSFTISGLRVRPRTPRTTSSSCGDRRRCRGRSLRSGRTR